MRCGVSFANCGPKRATLIFDNCEHVLGAAGLLIAAILRDCERITIVCDEPSAARNRRRNHLSFSVARNTECDRTLRRSRACRRRPVCDHGHQRRCDRRDLPPARRPYRSQSNLRRRARVCSRPSSYSRGSETIVLRLLSGGSRDVLPRHQTLRALIDWSHDLLSDEECKLFRRASIFTGAFSLEAGVEVSGRSGPRRSSIPSNCSRR